MHYSNGNNKLAKPKEERVRCTKGAYEHITDEKNKGFQRNCVKVAKLNTYKKIIKRLRTLISYRYN